MTEVSPPMPPGPHEPKAPPSPEIRLPPDHFLAPVWSRFAEKLRGFGIEDNALAHFENEFAVSVDTVDRLNNGEAVAGFQFEKNMLRYHGPEHTRYVAARTMQLLPGFLADLQSQGVDVKNSLAKIKGIVQASLYHEIGYLKRVSGDDAYRTQMETYFDHVDRGMQFAPSIVQRLGLDFSEEDMVFFKRMIRSTDFNMTWDQKEVQDDISGETKKWGEILWVSDLLASFSYPRNVPDNLSGLYWEQMARVVMDGKAKKWKRNDDGSLALEVAEKNMLQEDGTFAVKTEYVPSLVDVENQEDAANNYARVIEVKSGLPIGQPEAYEIPTKNIFQFVSSTFAADWMKDKEHFLAYSDAWYMADERNEIRENFVQNNNRAELLNESVKKDPVDDRLCIFEGSFTGADLRLWVEDLKRAKALPDEFKREESWLTVDTRVLGMDTSETPQGRVVTEVIRDVLMATGKEKSTDAIRMLLSRFREKMRGEGTGAVTLHVAPGAYQTAENGIFGTWEDAAGMFADAFELLPQNSELPTLLMGCTIRRDKDFGKGSVPVRKASMEKMAETLSNIYMQHQEIAGFAFLGWEEGPLQDFDPFFLDLRVGKVPLIVACGQRKLDKQQFLDNARYITDTLSQYFRNRLSVWGMQDVSLLSDEEVGALNAAFAAHDTSVVISHTFDYLTGLVEEDGVHPVQRLLSGSAPVGTILATANPALTAGSSSIRLDELSYIGASKQVLSNLSGSSE